MDYAPFMMLLLFPLIWLFVGALLAIFSGWFSLAGTFRKDEEPGGEKFKGVSGAIGASVFPVNYSHCLNLVVGPQGLYLRILFLFRFLCPPLLIPWDAIASATPKRMLFLFPYVQLRIRGRWQSISIYGKASNAILAAHSQAVAAKKR